MRFAPLASFALALLIPILAEGQDGFAEVRFHRVHLRNGNVVDGKLVQQTEKEVVLNIGPGEISFKMDMVDHVEFVRIRTVSEKPDITERPKRPAPPDGGVIREVPVRPPAKAPPTSVKLDPQTYEALEPLLTEYFRADVEMKQTLLSKMLKLGGNVPAYLISILPRFDRDQLPAVLVAIAQTKDLGLVPVMGPFLEHENPTLRFHVAMAIGMFGDPSVIPYLRKSLKDTDASVRSASVSSLAMLKSPEAFDPLIPALSDPDRETRSRAIVTLQELARAHGRNKEFGEALSSALGGIQGEGRLDLIVALGRTGQASQWNTVSPYLREDAAPLRQAAATALAELAAPESAEVVFAAVQSEKDSSVRVPLARAVQKLTLIRAGETLITWLDEGDQETKAAAASSLSALAGQTFGNDVAKWKAWWEKAKPQ